MCVTRAVEYCTNIIRADDTARKPYQNACRSFTFLSVFTLRFRLKIIASSRPIFGRITFFTSFAVSFPDPFSDSTTRLHSPTTNSDRSIELFGLGKSVRPASPLVFEYNICIHIYIIGDFTGQRVVRRS